MKKEDLFDILGEIDNQYIADAHTESKKPKISIWKTCGTVAACLTLLFTSMLVINGLPSADGNTPPIDSSSANNYNKTENLSNNKEDCISDISILNEELQARIAELSLGDSIGWIVYNNKIYIQDLNIDTVYTENPQNDTAFHEYLGHASDFTGLYQTTDACDGSLYAIQNNPDILYLKLDNGASIWLGAEESMVAQNNEDVSADSTGEYHEAVDSSNLSQNAPAFFGGSYIDENGNFVIVLTEDTPENRAAVCRDFGKNEDTTIFVKGTYSLKYLTELQKKITNAMVNKELPFVTTSGVYETTNNIIVTVTTNDAAELAKLYALDIIGGAIEVKFGSGAVIDTLVVPESE